MCSVIQNDILGNSIDKDMHFERIGQVGVKKYLRKSCYHHIECSAANCHIYVEKTPKQCCFGRPNSQRPCEDVRWDKHSSSGLDDRQVEGQDYSKRDI